MCSIPYSLLSKVDSSILPISHIQEHQNFCKLFSKAQSTYERKNEDNNNIIESNSPDNNKVNQNQLKIWSWFENLSLEQKIKICTIKNRWLVKIIIQLYFIYVIDNRSTFNPTNDMDILFSNQKNYQNIGGFLYKNIQIIPNYNNRKNYIGYNEDDYCKLYFNIKESDFSRIKKNTSEEQIQLEKKLLENIILLSIEDESLDTISLSKDLLKDMKNLKRIFFFFSDKNFLKDWLTPFNYSNYYNFTYPGWMHSNDKLTLCKILAGIFEQQILLLYEYFFYSKKLYEFPGINSIIDIYKENNNLEKFLKENYSYTGKKEEDNNKENILTLDIVIDVVNKIKNDIKYKNKLDNFKKMLDQLYNDYYRSQFYNGNKILTEASESVYRELTNEMSKEKGKEIKNLLNKITFMKLEDVKNYREFIYIFLRKYFLDLRNVTIINELLNEKQNKSGKKKKKKRKNKNKSIEPINIISNEDVLEKKNKDIIEENISLNNDEDNKTNKKQENLYEKKNNRNYGNNSCSSNENDEENETENLKRNKCKENKDTLLTIKQINNIEIENSNLDNIKESKKNKHFFLFPLNNKKQKNKNNNHKNNIDNNVNEKQIIEENNNKEEKEEKEEKE